MQASENFQTFIFKDDGLIPNSPLPLVLYRNAFSAIGEAGASFLESTFDANCWPGSWRDGIYNYQHYHTTSHEVLGVYDGEATLHVGGEWGQNLCLETGDVVIIPAGVGHKLVESTSDFAVVGACSTGQPYETLRGEAADRPLADQKIAKVPLPTHDPLMGAHAGLVGVWSRAKIP